MKFGVSERLACRVLGQHRSTQRKMPMGRSDEVALTADIVALATQYGRYGYRRIAAMLHASGWAVNIKRVERIWRREGLKVPARQPKKGRLWLNDGSCIRLRPEHPNHVWSYDFVEDHTHNGRKFRMLNVIDEFTRECIAIRIDRKLKSTDVIDVLSDLFILRGVPGHVRSDNGPEFVAKAVRDWITAVGRPGHRVPGRIQPLDPVDRMAIGGYLVPHGSSQNCIILDQQDAHGLLPSLWPRVGLLLTLSPDSRLKPWISRLQAAVSFGAHHIIQTGRNPECGPCERR